MAEILVRKFPFLQFISDLRELAQAGLRLDTANPDATLNDPWSSSPHSFPDRLLFGSEWPHSDRWEPTHKYSRLNVGIFSAKAELLLRSLWKNSIAA